MVRAIGVPSNVSGNCSSLRQSTLTQPAKSPPAAAAAPKRKNRTSTLDAKSDDYTHSLFLKTHLAIKVLSLYALGD